MLEIMGNQREEQIATFEKYAHELDQSALDLMIEELTKIKQQGGTFEDVLQRLSGALAPDITESSDIVTIQQAIDNVTKYGSIIPSTEEKLAYHYKIQQQRRWSLFWQSLVHLVVRLSIQIIQQVKTK